jgi:hypothetical protein
MMGYHLGALVTHFIEARKNDFIEMALHHFVTIFVFFGGYMTNILEAMAVIAFLHDLADIPTNLARVLSDTRYKIAAGVVFIGICMPVFFWTRCIVLPILIYQWQFYMPFPFLDSHLVIDCFSILHCCLILLHYYWFVLFVRITRKFIVKGEAEDIQNKTVAEKIKVC